jgi:hypothetical protein
MSTPNVTRPTPPPTAAATANDEAVTTLRAGSQVVLDVLGCICRIRWLVCNASERIPVYLDPGHYYPEERTSHKEFEQELQRERDGLHHLLHEAEPGIVTALAWIERTSDAHTL